MQQSNLAQLVYISRAVRPFTPNELTELVELSSARNRLRDVTGVLLSCGRDFMQLLEGDLATIADLFERIRHDPRHTDVRSLLTKNADRRIFGEWGMTLLNVDRDRRLDHKRLATLLHDVRTTSDTSRFSVEARVLLADFRTQLTPLAA